MIRYSLRLDCLRKGFPQHNPVASGGSYVKPPEGHVMKYRDCDVGGGSQGNRHITDKWPLELSPR